MLKVLLFLLGTSITLSPPLLNRCSTKPSAVLVHPRAGVTLLTPGNFRQNRSTKKCRNLCCLADQQLK